jgi:hypothetical protein
MPEYDDFYTMSEYAKTITDKKLLKTAKKAADEFIKEHVENQEWYRMSPYTARVQRRLDEKIRSEHAEQPNTVGRNIPKP